MLSATAVGAGAGFVTGSIRSVLSEVRRPQPRPLQREQNQTNRSFLQRALTYQLHLLPDLSHNEHHPPAMTSQHPHKPQHAAGLPWLARRASSSPAFSSG